MIFINTAAILNDNNYLDISGSSHNLNEVDIYYIIINIYSQV